jgi:hypothetical protein
LGARLARRNDVALGPKRDIILVAIIAILLVVSGALVFGIKLQTVPLTPLERAIADLRATPLLGQAMRDYPDAEKEIRTAMEEDQRNPVAPGVPPRAFYAIGRLSRDRIRPMLAAADDASALAVMAARFALATQLRADDPQKCREFAMNGIQRVDQLSPEAQKLFSEFLTRMEAAYRNGRAADGKPQPMSTPQEVVQLLGETGFRQVDLDDLNRFAALSSIRACDIDLKIDGAPPKLPPDKQGPFSRFALTH